MNHLSIFDMHQENELHGRYITLRKIEPLLEKLQRNNTVSILGKSVLENPIYGLQIGQGDFKILLWSQMHGNESTTTKALFDLFNFLDSDSPIAKQWKSALTFLFIPMLNPDGAEKYTRENANQIDLNRDFINLSQPESQLLFDTFQTFKPDFCFNLHDQRTIYAVGDTDKPATVSFLAPSYNLQREINLTRQKAINLISGINTVLQSYIPNQVGRFDDGFNRNCVGDTFQQLGVPTVLFEAGHFQNDYQREETRKFIFICLTESFKLLCENDLVHNKTDDYLKIPQNNPLFYDIVYRNVKINYDNSFLITNFASQFNEEIVNSEIKFRAFIVSVGNLDNFFGHTTYDLQEQLYEDEEGNLPKIDRIANFFIKNRGEFVNGLQKD